MSTAEGVGMEGNAQTIRGVRAVSSCVSPMITTVATTSAAHRGTTHHAFFFFWSRQTSENTLEWNEWFVCSTFL